MPDGTLVKGVPEGVTKAQLMAKYGKFKAAQKPVEDPNIFQRIGQDYDKRQANQAEINKMRQTGEQGVLSTGLQTLGQGAGFAGDVGMEALKGAFGMLPDNDKDELARILVAAANTRVGQDVRGAAGYIGDKFGEFKQENPVAGRNIEALGNMVGALPVMGAGKVAANVAVDAGGAALDAGKAGLSAAKNSSLVQGITARGADTLEHATDAMRAESTALYQAGKQAGAIYTPQVTTDIVSRINNAVSGTGKLNKTRHADTISAMDDLNKDALNGSLSLEEFDLHRQNLNEVIMDNTDAVTGRLNSDAHRALMARNALDDAIDAFQDQRHLVGGNIQAVELLNRGRAQWQKAAKFEKVSNIVSRAGGDPNKIKAGFLRFVSNKKNLKGFTPEEIAVLKAAANNTITEKILKGLGRFGIAPENVFLPTVGAGLGAMAGSGGAAGGVIAAGTAARQTGKWVARGKAEKALKEIEK